MPITSEMHVRGTGICKCTKKQIRSFKGNHEWGVNKFGQPSRCKWAWTLTFAKRDVAVWRL